MENVLHGSVVTGGHTTETYHENFTSVNEILTEVQSAQNAKTCKKVFLLRVVYIL